MCAVATLYQISSSNATFTSVLMSKNQENFSPILPPSFIGKKKLSAIKKYYNVIEDMVTFIALNNYMCNAVYFKVAVCVRLEESLSIQRNIFSSMDGEGVGQAM